MGRGDGPTALITGGNHGDEYEGPVALFNFAGRADISDIHGRVILVPAMNYPAFQIARRVSPIDSANLNRAFPGRPDSSITLIIADYFSRTLLPLADYVLDMPDSRSFLISQHCGLVEPCVDLGTKVNKGDLVARIHITERTAMPPNDYFAPRDGLVIARHVPSLIKMGDCLNVIAEFVG